MNLCYNYKDIISKRDVDRNIEEHKILQKYKAWLDIIEDDCKGKTNINEDEYFDKIFQDSEKYCLI